MLIQLNESVASNRIVYLWSVLSNGTSPAQFEAGGQPTMSVAGLAQWNSAGTLLAVNTTVGEYQVRLGTSDVSVGGPGVLRYSSSSALETSTPIQIVGFNPYGSISTFDASVLSVTVSAIDKAAFAASGVSAVPAPGSYSGTSLSLVAHDYASSVTLGMGSASTAAGNTLADSLLLRNVAGGASSGRTIGEAFAVLRNKVAVDGSGFTVYGVDDTTAFWHGSVATVSSTSGLITTIDPS